MKVSEKSEDRPILDDVPLKQGILMVGVTLYVVAMGFHKLNSGRDAGL